MQFFILVIPNQYYVLYPSRQLQKDYFFACNLIVSPQGTGSWTLAVGRPHRVEDRYTKERKTDRTSRLPGNRSGHHNTE
jgi:hypothetical protein